MFIQNVKGDALVLFGQAVDSYNNPKNITGDTITITVRDVPQTGSVLIVSNATAVDVAKGTFKILISTPTMSVLPVGRYYFDIRLITSDSNGYTIDSGILEIIQNSSK